MGHALTLDLPEDVYQGLIQQAEQTGQPAETVAVQLLVAAIQHRGDDPLERVHYVILTGRPLEDSLW